MVPLESSCHKEGTYEIPITYHSKYTANVKFLKSESNFKVKVTNFGTIRKVLL
jgi:hypothetical protein